MFLLGNNRYLGQFIWCVIVGLPKAVMLSHRNVVAAVLQFADIDGRYLSHKDVFVGVLPFYHIGY